MCPAQASRSIQTSKTACTFASLCLWSDCRGAAPALVALTLALRSQPGTFAGEFGLLVTMDRDIPPVNVTNAPNICLLTPAGPAACAWVSEALSFSLTLTSCAKLWYNNGGLFSMYRAEHRVSEVMESWQQVPFSLNDVEELHPLTDLRFLVVLRPSLCLVCLDGLPQTNTTVSIEVSQGNTTVTLVDNAPTLSPELGLDLAFAADSTAPIPPPVDALTINAAPWQSYTIHRLGLRLLGTLCIDRVQA